MDVELGVEELADLEDEFNIEVENDEKKESKTVSEQYINHENSSISDNRKDITAPTLHHLKLLRKYFGHDAFRPFQWEIIHSIIVERRDNCVVMATGYGKSLCYQYPSIFTDGLSIVISPLISLMEDQVQSLEVSNIPACFLGSAQSEKMQTIDNLLNGVYRLVYMTPELVSTDDGLSLLTDIQKSNKVTLIAIDEAHCVSKWGHDFRSAYRNLGRLRYALPNTPILAVTATATPNVQKDIVDSLKLISPQILCTGFDRPNLYYKVKKKSADKFDDISKAMINENKIFNIENGSIIIYCLTKKMTEEIADILKLNNIKAEAYHAGLNVNKRRNVHEQFMRDEIKVIVATIAFGMGIDKPNVRCVIHYGASCDIESYYQEAGRAGRDGNPSLCIMFHSPSDFVTHRLLREKGFSSSNTQEQKESLNSVMKHYISLTGCRRTFIISYFDKKYVPNSKNTSLCCDNCSQKHFSGYIKYEGLDSEGKYDFTDDVEKFLNAIKCFSPTSYGVGILIALLKGSKNKRIKSTYFNRSIFGAGSSKSEAWWKAIASLLEIENFIRREKVSSDFMYPVVVLGVKGKKWLENEANGKRDIVLLTPTKDILEQLKFKRMIPLYKNNESSQNTNSLSIKNSSPDEIEDNENITEQFNDQEKQLLKSLFQLRHDLAKERNIMPHTIASDIALHQLALRQPKSTKQLTYVDGMSDVKIESFGSFFIKKIRDFCKKHPQVIRNINDLLANHPAPPSCQSSFNLLNATQLNTIQLFNSGKSPKNIAIERKLAESTIISHLCCGVYKNSVDISKLIKASNLNCIRKIIKSDNLKNDMSKLGPIKNVCPPVITYDEIKLTIAYVEIRDHLDFLHIPYVDNYALKIDGRDVSFCSSTVYPDGNDVDDIDENESLNDLQENPDVVGKFSSVVSLGSDNKSNNSQCSVFDECEDFLIDDALLEKIDEIESPVKSHKNIDKIEENSTKSHDSREASCSSKSNEIEFPVKSHKNITKIEENSTKSHDSREVLCSSKSNVAIYQKENNVKDSLIIPKNETKKAKTLVESDTDSEECTIGAKRKLPNWKMSSNQAKNQMKSKLSKNSLFN